MEELRKHLPELPDQKKVRFISAYGISDYVAGVLVAEKETANHFEEMVSKGAPPKAAANWLINELFGQANTAGVTIANIPVSSDSSSMIVQMISNEEISGKSGKELLVIVWGEGLQKGKDNVDVRAIVEHRGLKQVTDLGAIEQVVDEIVAKNPDKVADAKSNPKAIGWFVG